MLSNSSRIFRIEKSTGNLKVNQNLKLSEAAVKNEFQKLVKVMLNYLISKLKYLFNPEI